MKALLLLTAASLLTPALAADAPTPGSKGVTVDSGVTPEEEIKFQQDRAEGHMRELEQRMFKLARLIRETEPDDSARLLMGLQKAREELIADRMEEAGDLLLSMKLSKAASETQEIVDTLEELRRMMLSADIDLEIKLEQLKKLKESRAKLAKLIQKETTQKEATDKRDADAKKSEKPAEAGDLAEQERRNERLSDDVAAGLKQLGAKVAGAAGQVAAAGGDMKKAAENLDLTKLPSASRGQADALMKLEDADLGLAKAEAEMQAELEKFVLKRVLETIDEMIARQEAVREATERLQPRVLSKDERAMAAVRGLEPREAELIELAEQCVELGELVELSLVLPMAMESIMDQVEVVSDQLLEGRADDLVVAGQKQIEEDLAMIYDALRDSSRSKPGQGQCKGCKGCRNKLLAEFKMLRFMQISLKNQTQRADEDLTRQDADSAGRRDRARPLSDRQIDIQRTTLRLHDMTCEDCLGGA